MLALPHRPPARASSGPSGLGDARAMELGCTPGLRDPAPPDEQRSKERAPACVPDSHGEVPRARGCAHVSSSKWHRHRRPVSRLARGGSGNSKRQLERGTGASAETSRIAEPAPFHVVRCRSDLGRVPSPFSREIATRGEGRGDRGVRGGVGGRRSTGRERPVSSYPETTEARTAS